MNFNFPPRTTRPLVMTEDGNDELCCPDCGQNYMHQRDVQAFNRFKEDGDGLLSEISADESTKIRPMTSDEIPGRRDSLNITFWCETCGEDAPPKVLQIMQHKGCTIVHWTSPPYAEKRRD